MNYACGIAELIYHLHCNNDNEKLLIYYNALLQSIESFYCRDIFVDYTLSNIVYHLSKCNSENINLNLFLQKISTTKVYFDTLFQSFESRITNNNFLSLLDEIRKMNLKEFEYFKFLSKIIDNDKIDKSQKKSFVKELQNSSNISYYKDTLIEFYKKNDDYNSVFNILIKTLSYNSNENFEYQHQFENISDKFNDLGKYEKSLFVLLNYTSSYDSILKNIKESKHNILEKTKHFLSLKIENQYIEAKCKIFIRSSKLLYEFDFYDESLDLLCKTIFEIKSINRIFIRIDLYLEILDILFIMNNIKLIKSIKNKIYEDIKNEYLSDNFITDLNSRIKSIILINSKEENLSFYRLLKKWVKNKWIFLLGDILFLFKNQLEYDYYLNELNNVYNVLSKNDNNSKTLIVISDLYFKSNLKEKAIDILNQILINSKSISNLKERDKLKFEISKYFYKYNEKLKANSIVNEIKDLNIKNLYYEFMFDTLLTKCKFEDAFLILEGYFDFSKRDNLINKFAPILFEKNEFGMLDDVLSLIKNNNKINEISKIIGSSYSINENFKLDYLQIEKSLRNISFKFFINGLIPNIDYVNISNSLVYQLLNLIKQDFKSTEYIIKMYVINNVLFQSGFQLEKLQKFNRVLNLQWAIDLKKELDELPN